MTNLLVSLTPVKDLIRPNTYIRVKDNRNALVEVDALVSMLSEEGIAIKVDAIHREDLCVYGCTHYRVYRSTQEAHDTLVSKLFHG